MVHSQEKLVLVITAWLAIAIAVQLHAVLGQDIILQGEIDFAVAGLSLIHISEPTRL